MKIVFCMWWEINRSNKFVQSFQVGVVRRVKRDSKQQVRMKQGMKLIRINLSVKLMWLGIHKYICLINFIHMGVVRHT